MLVKTFSQLVSRAEVVDFCLSLVLTGSEDVDKWEATMKVLESLIRRNSATTREVRPHGLFQQALVRELPSWPQKEARHNAVQDGNV